MATTAQILANRNNAQSSTGPRTPEGKAAAARNAVRHNLSGSTFALLPGEDPNAFDRLAAACRSEFKPKGEHETFLVDEMIQARWRIQRIRRLEAAALDEMLGTGPEELGPDARIVAALRSSGHALDKLHRYLASAERTYHKCHRELTQSRNQRRMQSEREVENLIHTLMAAPIPGRHEEEDPMPQPRPARMQNEPKPAPVARLDGKPITVTANAYGLGNPALRL